MDLNSDDQHRGPVLITTRYTQKFCYNDNFNSLTVDKVEKIEEIFVEHFN